MKNELRKPRGVAARFVVIALCAVLLWHFAATFTWNAAPNAVRAAIGQQTLSSYMLPMFGQSWSVFAPNPGSTNQSLDVRAIVEKPDGTRTTTGWVSLTDHSAQEGILHHPVPSRLYLNDFILADRYYASAMAIDGNVRDVAGKTYLQTDWPQLLKADLLKAMNEKTNTVIDSYLDYETAVNGLTSAVAKARWGSGVVEVQTRVLKTPVVPFAERNQKNATTTTSYFVAGWRSPTTVSDLSPRIFEAWYAQGAQK